MTLPIPPLDESLLLRTDFSDDDAWAALCALVRAPVGEFEASLSCVSDPAFDGLTAAQLAELAADEEELTFAFLADAEAIHGAEHTVLVVELWDDPGRTFRVAPHAVWSVQVNLEISNMDFEEFADAADEDGVFRGFESS